MAPKRSERDQAIAEIDKLIDSVSESIEALRLVSHEPDLRSAARATLALQCMAVAPSLDDPRVYLGGLISGPSRRLPARLHPVERQIRSMAQATLRLLNYREDRDEFVAYWTKENLDTVAHLARHAVPTDQAESDSPPLLPQQRIEPPAPAKSAMARAAARLTQRGRH